MGILIQPWHLIVFGVTMFLVFLTIGKMSKRHQDSVKYFIDVLGNPAAQAHRIATCLR
jgi:hypothetical protein